MLTVDLMRSVRLSPRPPVQRLLTRGLFGPALHLPGRKVEIEVDGLERIPAGGRIFIAMNHTDRYQSFPLQYRLMVDRDIYAAVWAKGKYYNRPLHKWFLIATGMIPTPSKGYLITMDAIEVLGRPLSPWLYRMVRDAFDAGDYSPEAHGRLLRRSDYSEALRRLMQTPRKILGEPFDPLEQTYLEALASTFGELMEVFVDLNMQAFDLGLKVIVFPEGTRSKHLSDGKPGLAQLALRTRASIVCVGASGTDNLYPGHNPFARPGRCVYRVGVPLTPHGRLKPYQIAERYRPFTRESHRFDDRFDAVTQLVMDELDGLVDPEYRATAGPSTGKHDDERFVI